MSRARRISAARLETEVFENQVEENNQQTGVDEVQQVQENLAPVETGITVQSDAKTEPSEIEALKAQVADLTSALLTLTIKTDKVLETVTHAEPNAEVKTEEAAPVEAKTEIAEGVTVTN